jgi:hypothetical protein
LTDWPRAKTGLLRPLSASFCFIATALLRF